MSKGLRLSSEIRPQRFGWRLETKDPRLETYDAMFGMFGSLQTQAKIKAKAKTLENRQVCISIEWEIEMGPSSSVLLNWRFLYLERLAAKGQRLEAKD